MNDLDDEEVVPDIYVRVVGHTAGVAGLLMFGISLWFLYRISIGFHSYSFVGLLVVIAVLALFGGIAYLFFLAAKRLLAHGSHQPDRLFSKLTYRLLAIFFAIAGFSPFLLWLDPGFYMTQPITIVVLFPVLGAFLFGYLGHLCWCASKDEMHKK